MKYTFLSLLLFFCFMSARAQFQLSPDWQVMPKLHELPEEFKKESAVVVLDSRHLEYRTVEYGPHIRRTIHRIVKVLDDKGIETFNKMTVFAGNGYLISHIKARTIRPDGSVLELPKDKIKLVRNENGSYEYAFALEGVEKGSEVEVFYTERRSFGAFGFETIQYSLPVLRSAFTLVVPPGMQYEFKEYNGYPEIRDTLIRKKRFYYASADKVPALPEEPYSNREAHLMRVGYRLSYWDEQGQGKRLFTWDELAKQLHQNLYSLRNKEEKVVGRYLQSIGVTGQDSDEEKIRKIEEALKTTINMSDEITGAAYEKFDRIVDKRLTTSDGYLKFFIACLQEAGIRHVYGATSNRFEYPLDEDFEIWGALNIPVIWFPSLNKYLAPTAVTYRMPFLPTAAIENKAVFINVGDDPKQPPTAEIKLIPGLPVTDASNNVDATISFSEEMVPLMNVKLSFSGHSAVGLREAFVYTPKEKQKELVQSLLDYVGSAEELGEFSLEHVPFASYYDNKPLTVTAQVQAPKLMEKAGPKYLFHLGDVIGQQEEMYQEKERKLPIEVAYPHSLDRIINVQIPDGYRVVNPEAVKISVADPVRDGKQRVGFSSDYSISGNKMTITVKEFYAQTGYPLTDTELFKKVINAAADFNKVVLVLEKKG